MRRGIIVLILSLVSVFYCQAQSIFVHLTDGSTQAYPLIDVATITFANNSMRLKLVSADTISWNVSTVSYYEYEIDPASVVEHGPLAKNSLTVYPNPSSGSFTIEYELLVSASVQLDIFGTDGRLIERLVQEKQQDGSQVVRWDSNLPSGVYICRLVSGKNSYNKLIVITH